MRELTRKAADERHAAQRLQTIRPVPEGSSPDVVRREALRGGGERAIHLARSQAADF